MGFLNSLFGGKKSNQLSREDEIEIMQREIAAGIGENSSLNGILSGLKDKELEEFVKKEKKEIREAYIREKGKNKKE